MPFWRTQREKVTADLRAGLGEKAFAAAWRSGEGLSREQAVEEALGSSPFAHSPRQLRSTLEDRSLALSPRENEVAELVARGLSNREIANTLVISQRTAENHVQHIMDKLGIFSRFQIAAWVREFRE